MAEVPHGRWLIHREPVLRYWVAMPLHRPWTVEGSMREPMSVRFGPIGTKNFGTQSDAIEYATSPYQAYADGWLP